jgi:hypothetical protein
MREIKFRAWDISHSCMETMRDLYWFEEQGVETSAGDGHFAKYIIEQYTGLKDKNGREIYQHDLFKDSTGVSFICWDDKYASWCLHRKGWAFDHFFGEAVDPDEGEVVGNIHEDRGFFS